MRRTVLLAAMILLFAAPAAIGGPSPILIAKRALLIAKQARGDARQALRSSAPPHVRYVEAEGTALRGQFLRLAPSCPQGYTAVAIQTAPGALDPVFAASYGRGVLVSMFNPSITQPFTGRVQITCVERLDAAASTRPNAAELLSKLQAAESDRRALLRNK